MSRAAFTAYGEAARLVAAAKEHGRKEEWAAAAAAWGGAAEHCAADAHRAGLLNNQVWALTVGGA
eukprot:gene1249-7821_t